jgi:pimeloyl-ACP methyl ester carboxylesterase
VPSAGRYVAEAAGEVATLGVGEAQNRHLRQPMPVRVQRVRSQAMSLLDGGSLFFDRVSPHPRQEDLMTPTSTVSASLEVPGARLYYELRGEGPFLVLVGAPMDATSFAPLADLLAIDHTVLTTDPRGINRSPVEDPDQDSSPALRAEDLSRLLGHLDAGPATVLGSSGGAVTALALAQAHPERVHTVIAHEPPVVELLDDREHLRAQTEVMIASYLAGDVNGAWLQFLSQANIALPDGVPVEMFAAQPGSQQAADQRRWFLHEMRGTIGWQPDIGVLRAGPTRIVVGIGDASVGQLCDRASTALAATLGVEPTMFPGGHAGFVEDPDGFAIRLRAVLHPS